MDRGYVKEHRKEQDSDIWTKPPLYFKVWRWILMNVDYKTGSLTCTYEHIGDRVRWFDNNKPEIPTSKQIGTIVRWLKDAGSLKIERMGSGSMKYTRLKVVNWALYNSNEAFEGGEKEAQTTNGIDKYVEDQQLTKYEKGGSNQVGDTRTTNDPRNVIEKQGLSDTQQEGLRSETTPSLRSTKKYIKNPSEKTPEGSPKKSRKKAEEKLAESGGLDYAMKVIDRFYELEMTGEKPANLEEHFKVFVWLLNNYSREEINRAIKFGVEDEFWQKQFASLRKLNRANPEGIKYVDVFLRQYKLSPNGNDEDIIDGILNRTKKDKRVEA